MTDLSDIRAARPSTAGPREPRVPDPSRVRRIRTDAEALDTARALAAIFRQGASARDRERLQPWDELDLWSESGLGGITVPKSYGGADVSFATLAEVFAVLSAADASLGQIPQNHFGLLGVLREAGTEAQKRRFYAEVLAGQRLGNAGPERRSAGSRTVLDGTTRLRRTPQGLRLSGTRYYSTGALYAHRVPARALDDDDRPVQVWVPRDAAGLTVIDDWSSFGQRTTASGTVVFDQVSISPDDVIPVWQLADRAGLYGPNSQLIQAAIDLGIADAAFDDAVAFVRDHARPWIDAGVARASDDPHLIADVGRLAVDIEAARAVLREAGLTLDEIAAEPVTEASSARASVAVAEAKVLTTEVALLASEKLFEFAGSSATRAKHNLDRHWRNARTHTLHDPVRWKLHLIGNYHLNNVLPKRHSWN
ncbi:MULTISPECIES: SfnB family sulfur acquisition oxidoreductase [unclassified Cupriavidus]|uniref:SfnB family sulfur acquisition oxidoreductase n=1 Tax=unclassified Cupriavidus TaxID=2640874 RepID=UPI001BFFEB1F|nr:MULTISPECIES: SfnB family sulfur acquisition oxidoreductase [unclassified Cupriavidus]MCA3183449.1 SfnB family sulfur acquisition oxidoreductase [Cupriavidus sp.]MCA3194040.1 SfnB family sulfur acquisition oxidoreductase [Cupriavidus sp.]MCA3200320.1 SfnB family sulfur acquisition oxidoreductase [Cupriavidus sp.]MCA3232082.1 SfnB family sulfur acquisition oxidoreductase [Cupriavidus sp.]QWE97557.1 SfnB family sulfur acquisition oxidoreductase [Cupriavidus sp. EM10]